MARQKELNALPNELNGRREGPAILPSIPDMILNCFDHALFINADIDPERYLRAGDQLSKAGIHAERLPAIIPFDKGCFSSVGQRGCAESHLAAVRLAKKRGYRNILILEDDIVFREHFLHYWNVIQPKLLKTDYDIFYFYRWREAGRTPENIRIVPIEQTLCTHAYAVRSTFYNRYIDIFEREGARGSSADRRFTHLNARLYAPTYNLIGQDANVSRITGRPKDVRFEDRFEI